MSVRIYQLSKQLGMENKELIALLKERGYEVASASSTISNIDADALLEELKPKDTTTSEPTEAEPLPPKSEPQRPVGPIVKSAPVVSPPPGIIKPATSQSATASIKSPGAPPPMPGTGSVTTPPQAPKAPPAPMVPAPVSPEGDQETPQDVKILTLKPPIVVREFAGELGIKPFRLISELMERGIFASINQSLDEDVAAQIAEVHGFILEVRHRGESQPEAPKLKEEKPKIDESKLLEPRPAVVCVLGHVDHGKTTVLDTIRKTNVVSGEAGGITQHIGAYQVDHSGHKITFIDTPGHAAFSKMRERGANVTDVAVLVVAADDGFMPQTDEALKFAQKANVPVVVAINKMDAPGANADKVKQQMQQRGIAPEDWGGETLCVAISALKNEGMEALLEAILLQAEMLEIKANPKCAAEGVIVESQVEVGRGSTATVIVQRGTLKVGDALVCGPTFCKVRAMMNERGERLKSAPPSTPVNLLGWDDAPEAGSSFVSVKNDREAKKQAEANTLERKRQSVGIDTGHTPPATMEHLLSAIAREQEKIYRVLIKADVHGSAEALKGCLEAIHSDKVKLEILGAEVGPISKNDIAMASASEAAIVGFNVKLDNGVPALAKHHNIRLIQHNIIYELIDQVKEAMAELLEPIQEEHKLGAAEVRKVFPVSKGTVAGCMITEGRFLRDGYARVHRGNEVLHEGKVSQLRRFKDDVSELRAGYEGGIRVSNFNSYQEGDVLECFEIKLVTPEL